jgi:serine/threonine-protein kinase
VRIHDLGEENGMLFLSMEYIAGSSLSDLLHRHGRLNSPQLRPIVAQICAALEVAHGAGVIHRDLKPGNILLDERQQVKVIDFGLAALPHLEGMTATGIILGTPEYMAPEQIRGQPVDPRTDVYALGALIYHALVGHPPFRGDSPIAVSFAQVNEPLQPPDTVVSGISPAWSQLVVRAMAKDPSQRFQGVGELAAALPHA